MSRSPQGERGLKSRRTRGVRPQRRSLPARGAWIEISEWPSDAAVCSCRSPQGERGLKLRLHFRLPVGFRHSPQGERGLKYTVQVVTRFRPRRSPQGERGLKWLHKW